MFTNFAALYFREVKRFQKIWMDTLLSPIVSIILYLSVFGIVAGSQDVSGIPYLTFVYSGLLVMMMVNSSFSNPSFALIISKNMGTIIDLQIVPIKSWAIGLAYALAALTRALVTLAAAVILTGWFIPNLNILHPVYLILSLFLTGLEFGMLGVVFGFWAKNFEALTFISTFVMQPMIFLAGVFYPVSNLPGPWSTISIFNPIHHNVNLFRYGLVGYSDLPPLVSLGSTLLIIAILFIVMYFVTRRYIKV